ncbi:hypothetical protein LTR08_009173 [Meristemomyces frigidus]|nr:hypothetical protein LTR08_009173 [Meristemomyces frigidus]
MDDQQAWFYPASKENSGVAGMMTRRKRAEQRMDTKEIYTHDFFTRWNARGQASGPKAFVLPSPDDDVDLNAGGAGSTREWNAQKSCIAVFMARADLDGVDEGRQRGDTEPPESKREDANTSPSPTICCDWTTVIAEDERYPYVFNFQNKGKK